MVMHNKSKFGKFLNYFGIGAIIGISTLFGTPNNSNAGEIEVHNRGVPLSGNLVYVRHVTDPNATEGFDVNNDSDYFPSPTPLQIYSSTSNPGHNNLSRDSRGLNSTTDYTLVLSNGGFSAVPSVENKLRFLMNDLTNFEWKNIFFNINGNKKDIKYVIGSNNKFDPVTGKPYGDIYVGTLQGSQTGVYNSGTLEFFNHADLNRDRKVNGLDWALFANEWGKDNTSDPNRFGSYVGSNVNDLGAYADINRSGSVDANDLMNFTNEWLWNADDPNTW